jgi:tetratricopeptide (TPR) repeat protein
MRLLTIGILSAALVSCAAAKHSTGGSAVDPRPHRPASSQVAGGPAPAPAPSHPAITHYTVEREILVELLDDEREPHVQAELLMRLADLAGHSAATLRNQIAEITDRCEEAGCGSADRALIEELEAIEQKLVDEEVAWLDRLVREHETYARADEALFLLGVLLLQHDQPDVALRHMRALIARYPSSVFVPSSYLAFGDHFYDRGEIEKAEKLYVKVLGFDERLTAPYARHKLGLIYYGEQDYARALDAFVKTVEAARTSDVVGIELLYTSALEDLVRAYAMVGKPRAAERFFERLADDRVDELLERLAEHYFDDGKYRDSVQIHRRLVARVECSTVQARSQLSIFEANLLLGDREGVLAESKRLAEVFVELGECLPPEELVHFTEVGVEAKQALKEQAAVFRAEYEQTLAPAAAQMADALEEAADAF